jgi:Tol biopolymer transport system component
MSQRPTKQAAARILQWCFIRGTSGLTGHLAYVAGGTLFALPFDVRRLSATGQPVPVLEGVRRNAYGAAEFRVSDTGSLIYLPGASSASPSRLDLALIDLSGGDRPLNLPPGSYVHPRVSPDGQRIAFGSDDGNEAIVWVYDLSGTSAIRRLTFDGRNRFPIWSADGQPVTFQSDRDGDLGIFWQRADGSGSAERLTTPESDTAHVPDSWSPNGQRLPFETSKGPSVSLWMLSVADDSVVPFAKLQSSYPINATFSPDGQWVAYSQATPRAGIFVQPFPPTGGRFQVAGGGIYPMWAPDGKRLFSNPAGQFVAVSVSPQPSFTVGNPVVLPRGTFLNLGPLARSNINVSDSGSSNRSKFPRIRETPSPGNSALRAVEVLRTMRNLLRELRKTASRNRLCSWVTSLPHPATLPCTRTSRGIAYLNRHSIVIGRSPSAPSGSTGPRYRNAIVTPARSSVRSRTNSSGITP